MRAIGAMLRTAVNAYIPADHAFFSAVGTRIPLLRLVIRCSWNSKIISPALLIVQPDRTGPIIAAGSPPFHSDFQMRTPISNIPGARSAESPLLKQVGVAGIITLGWQDQRLMVKDK